MMGTPAYMAPEQVLGHEIDARTDLYATGVVLYYLASGRLPFKGDTPMEMAQSRIRDEPAPLRSVRDDLPTWLGQVLDISLARDPERRFQTALLFREALRRGLAHLPIETPGPAPTPPELIATAAPRSMPILGAAGDPVAIEIPRATQPPPADMPTVATSLPVASMPREAAAAASETRGGRGKLIAAAAVTLLLVVAVGVFLKTRGSAAAPTENVVSAPVPAPSSVPSNDAPVPPAPPTPSSPAPSQPLSPTVTASPLSAGTQSGNGAVTPAPSVSAPAVGAVAAAKPVPPTIDGRAATTGTATAAAMPKGDVAARGRGRAVAPGSVTDAPIAFPDLRAFVVNGKKAEEQDAVLRFQGGAITLAADKGGRVFAAMPYREVTSAAFVRAKNPRWYPTLAAPPSGVDMPGGVRGLRRAIDSTAR
jgi:hypothetical protein